MAASSRIVPSGVVALGESAGGRRRPSGRNASKSAAAGSVHEPDHRVKRTMVYPGSANGLPQSTAVARHSRSRQAGAERSGEVTASRSDRSDHMAVASVRPPVDGVRGSWRSGSWPAAVRGRSMRRRGVCHAASSRDTSASRVIVGRSWSATRCGDDLAALGDPAGAAVRWRCVSCIGLDLIGQSSDLGVRLRASDRSAQQATATGWLC